MVAPDAVNETLAPGQIIGEFGVTDITGLGTQVTVTDPTPVQVPTEPFTVYIVVIVGFAITEDPVVADRPTAGDHI